MGYVEGVLHDDVIKWKHFPRFWTFVRGIHRSPVNLPHKGQWRGALMFSLICVWINDWVNNREAGDLRRHLAHYDVRVMIHLNFRHDMYMGSLNVPWYYTRVGWVKVFHYKDVLPSYFLTGIPMLPWQHHYIAAVAFLYILYWFVHVCTSIEKKQYWQNTLQLSAGNSVISRSWY